MLSLAHADDPAVEERNAVGLIEPDIRQRSDRLPVAEQVLLDLEASVCVVEKGQGDPLRNGSARRPP
jgi:hypothetical protein